MAVVYKSELFVFLISKLIGRTFNSLPASTDPYHAASGNFGYLGGCGACGVLTYNGKSRGFVITDVTDHKDDIGGDGWHIDLCLPSFNYFTNGQAGDGSHGGIFTGTWTKVDCSCMGAPS